jgi:hypothetical protein
MTNLVQNPDAGEREPALTQLPLTPKVAAARRGRGALDAGPTLRRILRRLGAGSADWRRLRL